MDDMPDVRELEVPVLPVRGAVLFPNTMMPLNIGRPGSLLAIDNLGDERLVAVFGQKDPELERPSVADLYDVGTLARIQRRMQLPRDHGTTLVVAEGLARIRIDKRIQDEPYLVAKVEKLEPVMPDEDDAEFLALSHNVRELFTEIVQESPSLPDELLPVVGAIEDPSYLSDWVSWSAPLLTPNIGQTLLETVDVKARTRMLVEELVRVREDQKLQHKIREDVKERITDTQRRQMLREQIKAIQRELGEGDEVARDVEELRERLMEAELPEEAAKVADRELDRLAQMSPLSSEYTVSRSYLDWLAPLPWAKESDKAEDLKRAAEILDEDHYGLKQVKERMLEHIAVLTLKKDLHGPILCFVGPPGVGKTSVGKSIARATGREFVRLSLGGMHDEAEIRGHRRTYVGALPGQILQGIRRAGTRDPVFMLDEVDKLGRDFRGDPAAALLEVLDPEQNNTFRDHYLEVTFDLSQVLFITTANILDTIPRPLLDRMEIIELPGYVDDEKMHIARDYLIPRQVERNGLADKKALRFEDDALASVIRSYTREAGVRKLEQQIAAICRKRAKQVVENGEQAEELVITAEVAREFLGAPRFKNEEQLEERTCIPGVGVALAWTPAGGDILFVEATKMSGGKGSFIITGQVREVMQESARAAMSWVASHADDYGLDANELLTADVHIHIPSGAVPKDGPSAGVVLVLVLLSLFAGRCARPRVAMTGEITLSGKVLPVGGIKEKVLAAKRNGVETVVLPVDNEADVLEEIPDHLREGMTFHFVRNIAEALEHSLAPAAGVREQAVGMSVEMS
jgi:ATP-dependent Lon protease